MRTPAPRSTCAASQTLPSNVRQKPAVTHPESAVSAESLRIDRRKLSSETEGFPTWAEFFSCDRPKPDILQSNALLQTEQLGGACYLCGEGFPVVSSVGDRVGFLRSPIAIVLVPPDSRLAAEQRSASMKITTRAICAGLVAVLFLGFVSASPAMAARTVSAGDVVNGRYEDGLLGSVGTAGDPDGGQLKIPSTPDTRDHLRTLSNVVMSSVQGLFKVPPRITHIASFWEWQRWGGWWQHSWTRR